MVQSSKKVRSQQHILMGKNWFYKTSVCGYEYYLGTVQSIMNCSYTTLPFRSPCTMSNIKGEILQNEM